MISYSGKYKETVLAGPNRIDLDVDQVGIIVRHIQAARERAKNVED
jgi:hypothetical protein